MIIAYYAVAYLIRIIAALCLALLSLHWVEQREKRRGRVADRRIETWNARFRCKFYKRTGLLPEELKPLTLTMNDVVADAVSYGIEGEEALTARKY